MSELTIRLSDDKLERLVQHAQQRGFTRLEDFFVALINDALGVEDELNDGIYVTISRHEIQSDTTNP
jgi:hypothetical protein